MVFFDNFYHQRFEYARLLRHINITVYKWLCLDYNFGSITTTAYHRLAAKKALIGTT